MENKTHTVEQFRNLLKIFRNRGKVDRKKKKKKKRISNQRQNWLHIIIAWCRHFNKKWRGYAGCMDSNLTCWWNDVIPVVFRCFLRESKRQPSVL